MHGAARVRARVSEGAACTVPRPPSSLPHPPPTLTPTFTLPLTLALTLTLSPTLGLTPHPTLTPTRCCGPEASPYSLDDLADLAAGDAQEPGGEP